MNREILFRGQTRRHGEQVRMGTGEKLPGRWVYGGVLQGSGAYSIIYGGENVEKPSEGLDKWPVYTDTVGQYTGLKDKNGKRIFEGDILQIAKNADGLGGYYNPALTCPVNVVVKWDMCAWMWETISADKRYISFPDAWCHYDCEIIGNIHDNPELIGGAHGQI